MQRKNLYVYLCRLTVAICLITIIPKDLSAQKKAVADTTALLLQIASHPKNDTAKVLLEYKLAEAYWDGEDQNAFEDACVTKVRALLLSLQLNWDKGIFMAEKTVGGRFYFRNQKTYADKQLQSILTLADKLSDEAAKMSAYMCIAAIYDGLGNKATALVYYEKAADYYLQKNNLPKLLTLMERFRGFIVGQEKNIFFIVLTDKVLKQAVSVNDKKSMARCYELFGDNYYSLSMADESVSFYKKAVNVYEELNSHIELARVLARIASIYLDRTHDYDKAVTYYLKAGEESRKGGGKSYYYTKIADCYEYLKKYDETEKYYNLAIASATSPKALGGIWRSFSGYYIDRADYVKAIEAKEKPWKVTSRQMKKQALL